MISLMTNKLKTSRELRVETQKELYLSGEELIGRVHFTPRKSTSIAMVKIYFVGEEFCAWSERIVCSTTPLTMTLGSLPVHSQPHRFHVSYVILGDACWRAPN